MRRVALVVAVLLVSTTLGAASAATAPAPPSAPAFPDYCAGQCNDILPPGANGSATLQQIIDFFTKGTRPPHSVDQLDKYSSLIWGSPGLSDANIGTFYDDASFGVPADQIASQETPRPDVAVIRDKALGIPHVYGSTRSGTMFGAGYAGAEDRLFLMDVLRHTARGQLTSFIGGSPGNQAFEQAAWAKAPYNEADYQAQFDRAPALYGADGIQLQQDILSYVDGVNAYLASLAADPAKTPGEYLFVGAPPQPWTVRDVVATSALIGGIFGSGGGSEIGDSLTLQAARQQFGPDLGTKVYEAFRSANDPEAPTTVEHRAFPYGGSPRHAPGRVLPDPGTVVPEPVVVRPSGTAAQSPAGAAAARTGTDAAVGTSGMSNALVVSAGLTVAGHPIAVFGPQTGYFAPQLLMQEELQGPGVSSRGVAFTGVNFYVQLGRGQDYSWSATSAGQDITDTFALPLCNTDGTPATLHSDAYLYAGQCTPFEHLSRQDSWQPNPADPTPAGSYTLVALRTKLGLVSDRGLVGGQPFAFARLRSTYFHEGDPGIGFMKFNDPGRIRSAWDFQHAASDIGFTFNWFYVDSRHSAYFNSGWNPVRAQGADPNFPTLGTPQFLWQNFDPATNTSDRTRFEQHPQGVDQGFFVSWNNKQAKDYSASDGQFGYGPVYRSQLLSDRIAALTAHGAKITRAQLVQAMESAATADLRGELDLPLLLRVIDSGGAPTDPALAAAVAALRSWAAGGAHRISAAPGATVYTDANTIQIMDAWWPLLVSGEFQPTLGNALYQQLQAMESLDDPANPQGSAYQGGWYGYVNKDLRTVLGDHVDGRYPLAFCGSGVLADCRAILLATLKQALAVPATQLYHGAGCAAGDQFCAEEIAGRQLGAIGLPKIEWQNRPTYQQVVQFLSHR